MRKFGDAETPCLAVAGDADFLHLGAPPLRDWRAQEFAARPASRPPVRPASAACCRRLGLRRRTRKDAERAADRRVGVDPGAAALHDGNDHHAEQNAAQQDADDGDGCPNPPGLVEDDAARPGRASWRLLLHPMDDRGWRRRDHELRDRVAISRQHQNQHEHVPQTEAVQRGRHALRRMNGERVERPRAARKGLRCRTARLRTNRRAEASRMSPPTNETTTHGPQAAMIGSA